jgi:hypothetical protein
MSYGGGVTRHPIRLLACVAAATALTVAMGVTTASADTRIDLQSKATSWDNAAAKLGTAGSLWDPMRTAGLRRVGPIDVAADGLTFARGRAISGSTVAAAQYGRGTRNFTISQKWANTGWAAEPAFTTSMARVGTVEIPLGQPGMRIRVRAVIYANCFVQPTDADPSEVPSWFRCAKSQVLTTGGVLVMTARPASTMTAPGNTSIVIQSSGLTYSQLVSIAGGLQQVAGASANGAGSAQMVAMCGQMVGGKMTFDQASAFAVSNGYSARAGSIDGVPQAVTSDFRPDRFTLTIRANAVTSCTYG